MGTRHLTCVVERREMKVAQYGQWDGYLSGQGQTIVDFISKLTKSGLQKLRQHVRECTWINPKEVERRLKSAGARDGWMTLDQSKKWTKQYPELSRDTGAGILALILKDGPKQLQDEREFAESLFCEWAYVVDLDNEVLEVYEGFQKTKHAKGRFASMSRGKDPDGSTSEYFPVKLVKKLPFRNIAKAFETFRAKFEAAKEAKE